MDPSDFKERRAEGKTLVGIRVEGPLKDLETLLWCRRKKSGLEIRKFGYYLLACDG